MSDVEILKLFLKCYSVAEIARRVRNSQVERMKISRCVARVERVIRAALPREPTT